MNVNFSVKFKFIWFHCDWNSAKRNLSKQQIELPQNSPNNKPNNEKFIRKKPKRFEATFKIRRRGRANSKLWRTTEEHEHERRILTRKRRRKTEEWCWKCVTVYWQEINGSDSHRAWAVGAWDRSGRLIFLATYLAQKGSHGTVVSIPQPHETVGPTHLHFSFVSIGSLFLTFAFSISRMFRITRNNCGHFINPIRMNKIILLLFWLCAHRSWSPTLFCHIVKTNNNKKENGLFIFFGPF